MSVELPESNWKDHFSATRDLLKMMAKEREIYESRSLEGSSAHLDSSPGSSHQWGSSVDLSSPDSSLSSPPPVPSASPASDYYSSYDNLLEAGRGALLDMSMMSESVPAIHQLGSRERYMMESPGHFTSRRTSRLQSYNSEGESIDRTASDYSVSPHQHLVLNEFSDATWDENTNEAYLDTTFRELSAIPQVADNNKNRNNTMVGPLHSTMVNNTAYESGVSSLYLEDIHMQRYQAMMSRSRMTPIGEEGVAEGQYKRRVPIAQKSSPPMGEKEMCSRHQQHHHHHDGSDCCKPTNTYMEICTQPSMLAYSMAPQQGSAPNSPLPRPIPGQHLPMPQPKSQPQPQLPTPQRHVTFNRHARVEVFQKESFETSEEKQSSSCTASKKKDKKKKSEKPPKTKKKSFKFFKCCTSANKTYSCLPEKDLPKTPPPTSKQQSGNQGNNNDNSDYSHIYETMTEARPPCVGKEATPSAPPARSHRTSRQVLSPCCGNQQCLGPIPMQNYNMPVNYTYDSDATGFMDHGLVRQRGVAAPVRSSSRMYSNGGVDSLGASFKTLALV